MGGFDESLLASLLEAQLGSALALDVWIPRGDTRCRAFPLSPLLHILSGNTPHAAFQSIVRGLLVGCRNRVKLPSSGLPEFEEWAAELPSSLADLIEVRYDLPDSWLDSAGAVVFGNQATLDTFRKLLPRSTRLIEHGPKLSIAVVFEPDASAADLVTQDILAHDQRGCLSVQAVYVDGGPAAAKAFAARLASVLENARLSQPRAAISLSDSGAISNARELARFRAANGNDVSLWESVGSTQWTVVYDHSPVLMPGPLNGFVTVHPLPTEVLLRDALGPEIAHLSTVAIHPFSDAHADQLNPLDVPRICPLGRSQQPPLFWHHDGRPPLADLVDWRDRSF
ncbi:MAG: hypothetical protein CFE26_09070 [Verrucomicrobiales bacterium VVV1]|nr:MAG: hypothetical protein CFE26_09070 [Verrucomicrobiales bacterium VVV1]